MGILDYIFSKKETKPTWDYDTQVPCDSVDCVNFLRYSFQRMKKGEKKEFYPLSDLIAYCLFCTRFKQVDMYNPKGECDE